MKLNPLKCKERLVNFMKYPNNIIQPICIGNHQLERVSTFKLLGVKVRNDLKWSDHIDYIYGKAAKGLYTLRVHKRAGVAGSNVINICTCSVRSILEYAVPAWQDIPEYLSVTLESILKRALKIVFPDYSNDEALSFSGLESVEKRRLAITLEFISA